MNNPYNGNEPYIFISYSHKDFDEVAAVINELQNQNYRVWYDEGIDPGTEWDKNIATHVEECEYFIAFISENYINSSNCKDELNFARDLEKKRFLVYLQEVDLPSEMKMRLSRIQNIHKYRYDKTEDFYNKLFSADELDSFKNTTVKDELKESFKDFIVEDDVLIRYIGKYESADVIIPEGIKTIGNHAFDGCENLKSITIPDSVTTIGMYAFNGCSGLDSITMPNSVKSIGMSAFEGCKNLVSIEIPNSVVSVGAAAFEGCEKLTSVTIPDGMANISAYTFAACDKLSSVIISEGVKSIGDCAFIDCHSLMSVVIPNSVLDISEHAFGDYTTAIRNVIPNNDNEREETDGSVINNIIADSNQSCAKTKTEDLSGTKLFGHLATDSGDILNTENFVQRFINPVMLSINHTRNLTVEFGEISNLDEKYVIAYRKKSLTEVVFVVFKKIDNVSNPLAIFEGKKIKKIYYDFIKRHKQEYHFADEEQMRPKIQVQKVKHNKNGGNTKKKHFTAQTVSSLYKNALNIPEKFEIPDKYQIIDAKILALLAKNFQVKVDEIIVPNSVEQILNNAFAGFKIKNTITIPDSVTSIGAGAISLSEDAYVTCSEDSYAYKYCKEAGLRNLPDLKKERMSKKVCQHCGGKFSGLFKKKCIICGKERDY